MNEALFAKWAFELDLEPVIDAFAVEFMHAGERFDHLACFQHIQTNSTVGCVGFLARCGGGCCTRGRLFIAECRLRVDDVPYLFRRELLFFILVFVVVLIILLVPFLHIIEVRLLLLLVAIRVVEILVVILLLLLLLPCVKRVARKVHLNILGDTREIAHHTGNVRKQIGQVGEARGHPSRHLSPWEPCWHLAAVNSLMGEVASLEGVTSEVELQILVM
jgi:hypothetical protein